jgi:ABC-2 type transport system ATP-binding protein
MQSEPREIVRIHEIVKDFRPGFGLRRRRVLHGISFSVREGEIFGFVGPNGAGKTTTLKVLMGLIRATSGEATILGHQVHETGFRRQVGFLPENPYFYGYLTGRETLRFYAKLSGVGRDGLADRVASLLEWVGLSDAADVRLQTYSKGMLQRLGIAQALVHDPNVVFLDEPMSGLDPIGRVEIRDLILRLRAEGKTVFMNTHILHDVEMVCDRVAIIVKGRIRYQGIIGDLMRSGGEEVDVVIANLPSESALEIEAGFGARFRGIGDRVEMRVSAKTVDRALQAAIGAGGNVISVSPHRVSLESFFLSAVEQDETEAKS